MWLSCMCIHMGMNVPWGWTNSPLSSLQCIFGQEPSRAWTCKAAFLTVLTWSYETRVGRGVPGGRFLASDLRSALQPTSMMGWVGQCSRTSGCHWNTHMQPHHESKQFCRQSHLTKAHISFQPACTNVCIRTGRPVVIAWGVLWCDLHNPEQRFATHNSELEPHHEIIPL